MFRPFIFLNILFFSSLVNAQEPLSLSDAIQIGLQRNFDISIEKRNVEIAEVNNSWGEAGRYPTITLNVNQNNGINDNVKTASPFQPQGVTISNSINPSLNLNWTLFNGFLVNTTKRRLEQLQAETEGNASIVIANSLQSIILGYYLSVLEQERLNEFKKQVQLSRDRYEYMKTKSEIGAAVTTDILLEEGNYLTDSVNFINQKLAFRNAVRNLNVILAEPNIDQTYVLTDSLSVRMFDYDPDELLNKMLNNNVDLEKQYITQSILGSNIKISQAERYPSLSLNAGFSDNRSRVDLSNAMFFNDDGTTRPGPSGSQTSITDNISLNFTLAFTLFNGGKINRAIKNTIIQEDIGNIQLAKMKNSLTRDLKAALDRWETRKQIYGINERREETAATNLEISEERYKNGSINSFDFRVVQNNYLSASILRLQALYNLIDSHVELMRLTGGLVEEYNN